MYPLSVAGTLNRIPQSDRRYTYDNGRRLDNDPELADIEQKQRDEIRAFEEEVEEELNVVAEYAAEQRGTRSPALPLSPSVHPITAPISPAVTEREESTGEPSTVNIHIGEHPEKPEEEEATTTTTIVTHPSVVVPTPRLGPSALGVPGSPAVAPTPAGGRSLEPRSFKDVEAIVLKRGLQRQASISILGDETLNLGQIKDEDIRKALDPMKAITAEDLATWDEEKLMNLVNHAQPQHLPVLMNGRLSVGDAEKAKNLSYHHLTYVKHGRTILNDVSGYIEPGMLVGVLGAPDSGITPLLNILAGREQGGKLTGDILYDGQKRTVDFQRWVGYVVKEDPHIAAMTVQETLMFSAQLRLPQVSLNLAKLRVALVLKLLGLSHVANSVVGDGMLRGISGGEKRRVSFGIEMVAGHACIIADLPTNGLDSASAYSLMRTMRFATRAGFSMMAAVVQPAPQMLRLFHRVLVMCKGSCIYFGPGSQAEEHFRSKGFIRPSTKALPQFLEELSLKPEQFYQPTLAKQIQMNQKTVNNSEEKNNDQHLDIYKAPNTEEAQMAIKIENELELPEPKDGIFKHGDSVLPGTINKKRYQCWQVLDEHYRSSVFYADVVETLSEQQAIKAEKKRLRQEKKLSHSQAHATSHDDDGTTAVDEVPLNANKHVFWMRWWYHNYNSSPWLQLKLNIDRQVRLTYRNVGLWRDTWLLALVMGIFLGTLFYDLNVSYIDLRNRVGLFFFILSYLAFNAVMIVPFLAHQRPVYYNQLAGGYYHGFAYYISHFLVQIPLVAVETFLLLTPVWGFSNLVGTVCGREYWYAYLMIGMNSIISRVWMILLMGISPNEVYADVLNTVTNIIFTKLCGYFVIKNAIVSGWYWMYVISYFTYALRGLAKNEFDPRPSVCADEGCNARIPGSVALQQLYDMDETGDKWDDFVDLVWFFIAFNFGAMLSLTYINWSEQDEAEPPEFGEGLEQKHQQLHSVIMKSSLPSGMNTLRKSKGKASSKVDIAVDEPSLKSLELANEMTWQHRVMTLPTEQVEKTVKQLAYLQWKDLNYTVMVGKKGGGTEPRVLLKKIFGYAKPGEMTALMGASGAGKSTLLDVLAGKKTGGEITGDILLNGRPVDWNGSFTRIAGYVEQFDSHNAHSTVREAVLFSGRLRLPRKLTQDELEKKVDHVLEILGIKHLQHNLIGSPGFGGVSQEVRKKVTIAVELIMEPSLLFLDEPTTGLDSAGAIAVMSAMQLLSHQGMTVVCTIHQPSEELAAMFDNLYLMRSGGQVVYFGSFDDLPAWFKAHDLGEIKPGQNPADFALDQIKKASTSGKNSKDEPIDIAMVYRDSEEGQQALKEITAGIMPQEEVAKYVPPLLKDSQPTFARQLVVMTNRFFTSTIRDHLFVGIRFFLSIFMGFVVGTVFLRLDSSYEDAEQRLSVIFVVSIFMMFTANGFLPEIFILRPIYFREQGSKMYHPFAFYLGRFISDIPFVVVETFLLCVMVYFICNLNDMDDSRGFGWFFFTMLGIRWASIFFTWLIGTALEHPNNANFVQASYFNLCMILAGFIIPGKSIQDDWDWLFRLTYLKYGFQFLVANEAKGEYYTGCDDPAANCQYTNGYGLMNAYGVDWNDGQMAVNQVVLWCFAIFFFICGYLALRYINHVHR